MTQVTEKRSATLARQNDKTVGGYAAIFNSPTDIGGLFTEVIAPGAFTATLASNADVCALYSHDYDKLLGRSGNATLRLKEDDHGLAVEIDLPDTSDGRDVATLIERGDLSGMSFGFAVRHDEWDDTVNPPLRTIHAVDLMEVTITAIPAYPDTNIAMRSLEAAKSQTVRKSNFNAAARRLSRKVELDLRVRR